MPATGKKRTKWNQLASIANNCNKNLKEKWEKNHEMLVKSQCNEGISWLESWWKYLETVLCFGIVSLPHK